MKININFTVRVDTELVAEEEFGGRMNATPEQVRNFVKSWAKSQIMEDISDRGWVRQ